MKSIITKLENAVNRDKTYRVCCVIFYDGTYLSYDRYMSYDECLEWARSLHKEHAFVHKGGVY